MKNNIVTLVQWYRIGIELNTPKKEDLLNASFENLPAWRKDKNAKKCIVKNRFEYTLYPEEKLFNYCTEEFLQSYHKIILSQSELDYLKIKLL